jgi:hypothetical protein
MDREMVFLKVFDDVRPTEVTGDPYINGHIDNASYLCRSVRMSLENFFDDCFPHGSFLSSVFFVVSLLISHIM